MCSYCLHYLSLIPYDCAIQTEKHFMLIPPCSARKGLQSVGIFRLVPNQWKPCQSRKCKLVFKIEFHPNSALPAAILENSQLDLGIIFNHVVYININKLIIVKNSILVNF